MKLSKTLILLFIFCLCVISKHASAKHVLGADIRYSRTADSMYTFTLEVYRDCSGVPFLLPNVSVANPISGFSKYISTTSAGIENITSVCDTFTTNLCDPTNTFGGGRGVEKHTFTATLDLTDPTNSNFLTGSDFFIISFRLCCRNSAITTGAANNNFYTEAKIYTNFQGANSSPHFYEMPFTRLNVNQPFRRNFGGYDADGDSLVFEMKNPMSVSSVYISYNTGFSKEDPFTTFKPTGVSSPNPNLNPPVGFHLNSTNGFITMTPTANNEVSVMNLLIKEYRNGVLISQTQRDMQFWVETIDNNLSHTISGITEVCVIVGGDSVQFDLLTDDSGDTLFGGTPDSIRLSWDNPFTGPSFTVTPGVINGMFEEGYFKWVPTYLDARKEPYMLTFSAIDNNCPYNHRIQKTIRITVLDKVYTSPMASFTWEQKGDTTFLTNTSERMDDITSMEWVINGTVASSASNFDTLLTLDTIHEVDLRVNYNISSKCGSLFIGGDTASQQILPKSCIADFKIAIDSDTTNFFRIFLINTSIGTGLSNIWYFSDGDSVIGTGFHNFTKFGKYNVCLEVSNSSCTDMYCDSVGMDSLGNLYKKEGFTIVLLDEKDLTSIEKQPLNKNSVAFYPNPFSTQLTVKIDRGNTIHKLSLRNMQGKIILEEYPKSTELILQTSDLRPGLYLVRVTNIDGRTLTKKIIKQ